MLGKRRGIFGGANAVDPLEACRVACEQHPRDPYVWLARADLAKNAGGVDETVDSLFHAARLFARGGESDKAVVQVSRILEIDPTHPRALKFRGLLNVSLQGWSLAVGSGEFPRLE